MPSQDPNVYVPALVALVAIILGATGLYRRYGRRGAVPVVATDEASVAKLEADRRTAERKAKEDFELAVKEGRILPTGRPKCQASLTCPNEATRPKPHVLRDTSFTDFIRTRFGAPERYRMVDPTPSWFMQAFFGAAPPMPELCETHEPVAQQVTVSRLADDERAEQDRRKKREVGLSTFEAKGMMLEVARLCAASETEATQVVHVQEVSFEPSPRQAPQKKRSPSRRPPAINGTAHASAALRGGNGVSTQKVLPS